MTLSICSSFSLIMRNVSEPTPPNGSFLRQAANAPRQSNSLHPSHEQCSAKETCMRTHAAFVISLAKYMPASYCTSPLSLSPQEQDGWSSMKVTGGLGSTHHLSCTLSSCADGSTQPMALPAKNISPRCRVLLWADWKGARASPLVATQRVQHAPRRRSRRRNCFGSPLQGYTSVTWGGRGGGGKRGGGGQGAAALGGQPQPVR